MIEHDDTIGTMLKALDDMGIADNTIVVYTTDNGPHMNTWPDGAMTPFRSEKNTNWEGAFRVPCLVRWPGHIKPGTVTNELMSHNDWMPTLCVDRRRAGHRRASAEAGYTANGNNYKVHLDGYDQSEFLTSVSGTVGKQQRREKRARQVLLHRRRRRARGDAAGRLQVRVRGAAHAPGRCASGPSRSPSCACRRSSTCIQDPFERADITSNTFWDWQLNHVGSMYGVMDEVFAVRRDVQGVPAALVPAELQPGEYPRRDARRLQNQEDAEREHPRAHSRRAQQDDRKTDAGTGNERPELGSALIRSMEALQNPQGG